MSLVAARSHSIVCKDDVLLIQYEQKKERARTPDTDKSGQVNMHILSYLFYAVSVYSRAISTGFNRQPNAVAVYKEGMSG